MLLAYHFSTCVTPGISHRPHPEGEPCVSTVCSLKCDFFAHRQFLLFRPRVCSRALGPGARRESARTPLRMFGPWLRSVTRALGVQSRENWQVTTGRHSEHVQPSRSIQTHIQVKKMSDGLRKSFRILLPDRTDCLPTSRLCWNARARARVHVVIMLECSWPCSRAHVRARLHRFVVFECCRARACARALVVRRACDDVTSFCHI